MILILTQAYDPHADAVIDVLNRKNAKYVKFQTEDIPQKIGVRLEYTDDVRSFELEICDSLVSLDEVRAVWNRRPEVPIPAPNVSAEDQKFIRKESNHVLGSLYELLRDRFWVNSHFATRAAEHKPYQLQMAQAVGFEIPKTLITNRPEKVLDFYDSCKTGMIYKSLGGCARVENGKTAVIYTTRVERENLVSYMDQIKYAPCIFQEEIPKQVELRVVVIGNRIFTDEISSQNSKYTNIDWRRYFMEEVPHRRSNIPSQVEKKIHDLMSRLGLVFACLDMVKTPDGRFVFLELNPNGNWQWTEDLTGLPLLENFTEMLIQGTPSYLTTNSMDNVGVVRSDESRF